MKDQNIVTAILYLGVVLSVMGIIFISIIGRSSYIFIGVGVVLMIGSWMIKKRMR